MLAESAVVNEEDGKVSMLSAAFGVIRADSFPHEQQQLALVFQFQLDAGDGERDHRVSVKSMNPDGRLMGRPPVTSVQAPRLSPEDPPIGVTLVLNLDGMKFPKPGDYSFVITFDDFDLPPVRLRLMPRIPPRLSERR